MDSIDGLKVQEIIAQSCNNGKIVYCWRCVSNWTCRNWKKNLQDSSRINLEHKVALSPKEKAKTENRQDPKLLLNQLARANILLSKFNSFDYKKYHHYDSEAIEWLANNCLKWYVNHKEKTRILMKDIQNKARAVWIMKDANLSIHWKSSGFFEIFVFIQYRNVN